MHLYKILLCGLILVSCQDLPDKDLMSNGITNEEILKTKELKGNNGFNGNFLVYRMKKETKHNLDYILGTHFALSLYTRSKELIPVIPWRRGFPEIEFFEFSKNNLLIVLRTTSIRPTIEIVEFNLATKQVVQNIKADIPCEFPKDCDWINFKEKKLAFFTNFNSNLDLKNSSVYEYDWRTKDLRKISRELPLAIDAVSGRNANLKSVEFNVDTKKFEYDLE